MIREVQSEDYAKVQEIAMNCFEMNIKRFQSLKIATHLMKRYYRPKAIDERLHGKSQILVEDDNGIKGFIEIQHTGYIANIFVDPMSQRRGYGKELMDAGIEACLEVNPEVHKITLDASKDAIPFYNKYGFIFLNRTRTQFGVDFYPMEMEVELVETDDIKENNENN